jgi:hypothetical protein
MAISVQKKLSFTLLSSHVLVAPTVLLVYRHSVPQATLELKREVFPRLMRAPPVLLDIIVSQGQSISS